MKKLRLGVIGLGQRGSQLMKDIFVPSDRVCVSAVCDVYEDRIAAASALVTAHGDPKPYETTDYTTLLDKSKIDLVIVATPWKEHVPMACLAMERGIPCGIEVGGAQTLDECYQLVETWEKTHTPFMFMENCCYGRREMMVLNMVKKGLFGTLVHCAGGYQHDLRDEISFGRERRHYRLDEYRLNNRENYPTHELGPIAKVLDINHGNRFVSLTATASKAAGLHDYILQNKPDDAVLKNTTFAQGDIVTTVLKTENGETVVLTLDTTLPRYYSRGFTVRGTKGMYEEATDSVFLDGNTEHFHWRPHWGNATEFTEEYDHEVWKKYLAEGVQGGHDGMDYLVYNEFFDCVREGRDVPIDVYDAAVWMAVTPLSEMSLQNGSAPVAFPDFKEKK